MQFSKNIGNFIDLHTGFTGNFLRRQFAAFFNAVSTVNSFFIPCNFSEKLYFSLLNNTFMPSVNIGVLARVFSAVFNRSASNAEEVIIDFTSIFCYTKHNTIL